MTAGKKRTVAFEDDVLKRIGTAADDLDIPVFAVGGFVRDRFMARETNEIDFVVLGDGPSFAAEARKRLHGHGMVTFERFGTASFLWKDKKLEFVSAREESYSSHSRKPVIRLSDLRSDLARRDFTVNTLAVSLNESSYGQLHDPFEGRRDIAEKRLRTPLDPEATFSDDPLRMMRAARFAGQLGFRIDSGILEAMKKERERIRIVSQERITEEFLKILSHPKPSVGLRILQDTRILEEFFPELAALEGVDQRDAYHHKDVFYHTLKVLDNLAGMTEDKYLRFSALVHDIGKPRVKRFIEGTGWTFHGHELVGVRMLRRICQRLKLSREYYTVARKMTRLHMRPIQLIGEEVTDSAIRRLLVQAGEQIEDLMLLCRADITSGNPKRVRQHLKNFDMVSERMKEVEAKDRMRAFQSPVRGDEIMEVCGLKPGPLVGKIKNAIEEAILDGIIPNEHDAALDYLLSVKDEWMENRIGGD